MVKYFLFRPIAVMMMFLALIITGAIVFNKIPVSLLPNIDVPKIVIRISAPDHSASEIEENIIRPIRESLRHAADLKDIESRAADHTGYLELTFNFSAKMDHAYQEITEKLDRMSAIFPPGTPRPEVLRINTSDIPIVRIQVTPKNEKEASQLSELAEKILKKRFEQLEGVSFVDINGLQKHTITVIPNINTLQSLGINQSVIAQTIQNANIDLGGLSVKDGQYHYFINLSNVLTGPEEIGKLPVRLKDGTIIEINQVARVEEVNDDRTGYHLFNGKEGAVLTIQKQPESRMNDLSPRITDAVKQLSIEFPKFNFATTRDQTFLLEAGISNLNQDLLYGGALTVALLFLFLGNWSSPALMSINIPLSLIISFVFFYIFHVSFNIISLSGLALGIGMLIDNSIVVIDNINRKQKSGISVEESAVQGTNEVIVPVISQVLTTIAVYAPLLMLNGLAAPLIYDQSIALTISLGVSLLVAFVLSPVLYRLLLKARSGKMKDDTIFFTFLLKNYHRMISHILRRRGVYFSVTLIIMPLGFWLMTKIPVSSLPKIEKKDGLFLIDWNEQVDARENLKRTQHLLSAISRMTKLTEADVGIKQFLLQDGNNAIQNTEIYYSCDDEPAKYRLDELVKKQISTEFPTAVLRIIDAPNAFTQLFVTSAPYFEARFRPTSNIAIEKAFDNMDKLINHMQGHFTKGFGMLTEADIEIRLDYTKMSLYNVSKGAIENTLKQYFGHDDISRIERFSNLETIKLATGKSESLQNMNILITSENGIAYQLNNFLTIKNTIKPKYITADRSGVYQSLSFDTIPSDPSLFEGRIASIAASNGFFSDFKGSYLDDAQQIMNLKAIFLVVLALLYFILAIQYQNLFIPLIVMLTIPLGITGSMFLLWLTGGTLDVMAAIGFVVVLGLIVDDPILKVEVLHRLEKEYLTLGKKFDNELLASMIHEAGAICLKPLLLVSLTTSIAVVPVLFVGGIGNDLQKPLSIVIIGGLTIGTFFTTWFIPLAYWYYINIKLQLKKRIKRNVF